MGVLGEIPEEGSSASCWRQGLNGIFYRRLLMHVKSGNKRFLKESKTRYSFRTIQS